MDVYTFRQLLEYNLFDLEKFRKLNNFTALLLKKPNKIDKTAQLNINQKIKEYITIIDLID